VRPDPKAGRDLALYERLISWGIAEADARGSTIDHVTARRMALWMLPRTQDETGLMRGLIRFARTGAITDEMKSRLRSHARQAGSPLRPQAARLLQYVVARGADRGPVGEDFGAVCDEIDRADAMLEELRDRVQQANAAPKTARANPRDQHVIAMARHDPASQTVSILLDAATANAAIHAISTQAADREARTREIEQYSQHLPEDSYGRRNRENIAARETRIATRLRAIERAYRAALDPETTTPAPELAQLVPADKTPTHELELE
jgi:hypothetical protein